MGDDDDHVESPGLFYPLYLDVPMMVSFLATLEDGVSYHANVSRKSATKRAVAGSAEAGLRLPSLLGLLPFNLRGELGGNIEGDQSEELQLVKRHTEASLFNKLRDVLEESDRLIKLENAGGMSTLRTGAIVEVPGTITRNPFEGWLVMANRLRLFMENTEEKPPPTPQVKSSKHWSKPQGNQTTPRSRRGSTATLPIRTNGLAER